MGKLYLIAKIVDQNKKLGIETRFFQSSNGILGYVENGVNYLNDSCEDIEKVNMHETLHQYEDSTAFKIIKESLLNLLSEQEKINLLNDYRLRYAGLYSEKEIENGILYTEIAIDMIIGNGKFSREIQDFCKNLYQTIIKSERNALKTRRFLNLSLPTKITQHFSEATIWEKLFVLNYYDGQKHIQPIRKESKYQDLRRDIEKALKNLYEYAEDKENFRIFIRNNLELEREYKIKIKALEARGEKQLASHIRQNKQEAIKKLAKRISRTHQAEYKHIVDFIKSTQYEPAFKFLMLNETLTKIYKQEKDKNKDTQSIVKKREEHRSIAGHMTLNADVLRIIYNNLTDYSNFANLYFAGVAVYNKKITQKSAISLDGIETFGMGRWLKFEGKQSNEKEFIKNSQKLASLVQNTPWCTKTLASVHLEQGDFFVFVDQAGVPHIAVKMNGKEIDEVRGIKNGNAQEIEEDYRKVAMEFVTKTKISDVEKMI